jgi:uncharacterized protein (TIGR02284 family)
MDNEYGTTQSGQQNSPSNDDVISTINGLIETCKDGQEGFKQAAEGVQNSQLKSVFYELGQQRSQFVGELQGLVRELGGDPENSGSFTGAIHRGWINIKSVVTGKDDTAILNECERGEDVAKNAYKEALEQNLPMNVQSTIQKQYSAVQSAHDQVKALRDSSNNTTSTTANTSY